MDSHWITSTSGVVRMSADKKTRQVGIIEINVWLLAWCPYSTFLEGIFYAIRHISSYSKTTCFTFMEGISMTRNSYLHDSKTTCFTSRDDRGTGRGDMVFLRKGWFDGPSTGSGTVKDGLRDRGKRRSPGALLLQGSGWRKSGGLLLSRIALQYHRRRRA